MYTPESQQHYIDLSKRFLQIPAAKEDMGCSQGMPDLVFQAALPLTVVPLDVTTRVGVARDVLRTWTSTSGDPLCRIVSDMTARTFDFAEQVEGHGLLYFHDPLAVLAAVEPPLMRKEPLHVEVEMVGRVSRGATVADRRHRKPEEKASPNMQVAVDIDAERALSVIRSRLCPWS